MSHKYARLMARLVNQPLLISASKLEVITEMVTVPLFLGLRDEIPDAPSMSLRATRNILDSGTSPRNVAVIEVFDSLVSKNASAASGMTSYESISNQIDDCVNSGFTEIGFYIDSPGGEAFGLFPLTAKIRGLAQLGITTWAFTDGMATSAAYAIGAACGEFFAVETSVVASIGVIMSHLDVSQQDATQGKVYTIFRSKSEKALGDSHTALTDAIVNKFETMLAVMDTAFNNDILTSRKNLDLEAIVSLKGSELSATEGLRLGLIDKVVPTFADAIANSSPKIKQKRGMTMQTENTEQINTLTANLEAAIAAKEVIALELMNLKASIPGLLTDAKLEILSLLELSSTLRIDTKLQVPAMLQEHLEAGFTHAQSESFVKQFAKTLTTPIDSSSPLDQTLDLSEAAAKRQVRTNNLRSAAAKATGKVSAEQ